MQALLRRGSCDHAGTVENELWAEQQRVPISLLLQWLLALRLIQGRIAESVPKGKVSVGHVSRLAPRTLPPTRRPLSRPRERCRPLPRNRL